MIPHCETCISLDLCTNEGRCYKMETNCFPRTGPTPRPGDMEALAAALTASGIPTQSEELESVVRIAKAWELRWPPAPAAEELPITMEPNEEDAQGRIKWDSSFSTIYPPLFVKSDALGKSVSEEWLARTTADTESELRKGLVAKGWITPEDAEQARVYLRAALNTNVGEEACDHCINALSFLRN